ncbi:hypothetical protein [Actinomadura alba]|uniref:Uncharacterized protein n=1 Tax=Actinomadura alba TaxID=406431 RepID=A0ABR7M056_9ACTN|nr:hypothetical protein [Actinomadura alba]MBC6470008.1 hypothetical protein [Actinomadura alba]
MAERLVVHFDEACIDLAHHLNTSGRVADVLGRSVPIVVFDMYRPGWEGIATKAANPPELVERYFQEWNPE